VPAALEASPRGTALRIKLAGDHVKRRCILLTDLAGLNLNYVWRIGVVVLSTDLPESEWHPQVTATSSNLLPTQHAYRARTELPLAIRTDEVVAVGGAISATEMAAIDKVLKTLYGI